jgi:hypothetical protein
MLVGGPALTAGSWCSEKERKADGGCLPVFCRAMSSSNHWSSCESDRADFQPLCIFIDAVYLST